MPTALELGAFSQLLRLLNAHLAVMKSTVLSFMVHLQFVHSAYVNGTFVSALSDFTELDNGSIVIEKN